MEVQALEILQVAQRGETGVCDAFTKDIQALQSMEFR
jgi:hypothetical protein